VQRGILFVIGIFVFDLFYKAEFTASHIDGIALVQPSAEVDIFAGDGAKGEVFGAWRGGHFFFADGACDDDAWLAHGVGGMGQKYTSPASIDGRTSGSMMAGGWRIGGEGEVMLRRPVWWLWVLLRVCAAFS